MTRRGIPVVLALGSMYAAGLTVLVTETPARANAPNPFPFGSSYSRSENGAALALAYLRGRGHRVLPLLSDTMEGVVPESAILVIDPRLGSAAFLSRKPLLTLAEERFVREGGRVVLCLGGSVPEIEVSELKPAAPWVRVHPDWPSVSRLDPGEAPRVLGGPWLGDAYAVFASADQPVVARKKLGRGDIVAIASVQLFENAHLDGGQNLEFLEALVAGRPAVYFDETVHGLGAAPGMIDLLGRWKLIPFVLALLALALAILVRKGRGLGAPDRDDPPKDADAVDLVRALGRLYARSLGDDEALGLHRDHLRRVLSEKTSLRGPALRSRVDGLLSNPGSKPRSPARTFELELAAINQALRRAHEQPR